MIDESISENSKQETSRIAIIQQGVQRATPFAGVRGVPAKISFFLSPP
jgi:hypothetical protein